MIVTAANITKSFDYKTVLKNVTFSIASSSITLLTGANGTGKTTLLRLLAGLTEPTEGSLEYSVEKHEMGYLGHQTFIYPSFTALENLRFWQKLYKIECEESQLLDLLQQVELKHVAHDPAGTFSRGMAQRLSLARVLLTSPRLLLLDEPGTGLDTRSLALLHASIQDAKKQGAAIVWITHTLETDIHMADAILHLEQQNLAFAGNCADFLAFTTAKNAQPV